MSEVAGYLTLAVGVVCFLVGFVRWSRREDEKWKRLMAQEIEKIGTLNAEVPRTT